MQHILLALFILLPTVVEAGDRIIGFTRHHSDVQRALEDTLVRTPLPENCEAFLFHLVRDPHHAGSPGDRRTAEYVDSLYKTFGFKSSIVEYWTYLPYPIDVKVSILDKDTTHLAIKEDSLHPAGVTPFNAYSPSCDTAAEVIYANRGLEEDYRLLSEMGIDVKGRIVLARYGGGYRGGKAYLAERAGAAGLILFSDPADDGYMSGDIYPDGPMRPWDAVQRGSISYSIEYIGDPLTPGFAATKDAQRIPVEKAARLPKVPTTPLSMRDAQLILKTLAGPVVPRDWQGGIPLTYHVGPSRVPIRMKLSFDFRIRPIWNNIAVLSGSDEPEKKIIIGNHRDAWVHGAVDPNAGTAAMLEAARTLGQRAKAGWRPKRSLVFCHWDAEEYGIIGSTEWGEEHLVDLHANGVVYLNFDGSISGPDLGASGVPSLDRFLRQLALDVPGVLKDSAQRASPLPTIGRMGGGSDFVVFLNHIGIPSAEWGFGGPYGVYHSAYDNLFWMKKFGDPGFTRHATLASMISVAAARWSCADVLPYRFDDYAAQLRGYVAAMEKSDSSAARRFSKELLELRSAIDTWESSARRLHAVADSLLSVDVVPPLLNRKLVSFERFLTSAEGLPGRPWFRHLVYAPGKITGYATLVLPGISDQLDPGYAREGEGVGQEIAVLTNAIRRITTETNKALDSITP